MGKWIGSAILVLAVLLQAEPSFAKKVCLQDDVGGYWELTGGKIDKQTYSARYILPGSCEVPGYANAISNGTSTVLDLVNAQDTAGNCQSVLWVVSGDELFNGTGAFDTLGDGSIDGTFTMTRIDCDGLPQKQAEKTSVHKNPALHQEPR